MFKNLRSVAALLSLFFASGCLFESTIDASGGATMQVSYKLKKDIKLDGVPKDMKSDAVEGIEATQAPDGMGTFRLKVKDITKLSTAKYFRTAETTRTVDAEKGTTTIKTRIKHKAKKVPDNLKAYFGDQVKFVTTVPGEITETNATSKDGKTATWVFTMDEFFGATEVPLDITYKTPS